MNERGQYGSYAVGRSSLGPRGRGTSIGAALFHSSEDEARATAEIDTGFESLVDAMYRAMGVPRRKYVEAVQAQAKDPGGFSKQLANEMAIMRQSPYYAAWVSKIAPVYEEWKVFKQHPGGGVVATVTSYLTGGLLFGGDFDKYQRWQKRLAEAYAAAVAADVPNLPAPPKAFDETLPEKVRHAVEDLGHEAKKAADTTFDLTKVAIYGGLAIVGVLAVTMAVQTTRSKDSEGLVSLVRGRR